MIRHLSKTTKQALMIALVAPAVIMAASSGMAFDKVNKTLFGVAIKGYDTVAYHAEKLAVKGKSEFANNWSDAVWHFASAENRDLFVADPERYAPQYGGLLSANSVDDRQGCRCEPGGVQDHRREALSQLDH